MVHCRYIIVAYVLEVHHEVKYGIENAVKDNLWYLKLIYSQKGIEHQESKTSKNDKVTRLKKRGRRK